LLYCFLKGFSPTIAILIVPQQEDEAQTCNAIKTSFKTDEM